MAFSKLDGKGIDLSSNVLTSFASTGIDDNATSTAITINSSEQVGISTTAADALTLTAESTTIGPNMVFANTDGNLARIATQETNTLRFETGPSNTPAMYINGSQFIGIGISDPQVPLDVDQVTGDDLRISLSSSDYWGINAGSHFNINDSGTIRFKIYDTGKVLIGDDASPETLLHLRDSSTAAYAATSTGLDSYTPRGGDLLQVQNYSTGVDDVYAGIWFETGNPATNTTGSNRPGRFALVVDNSAGYGADFIWQLRTTDAELKENLRLTHEGNLILQRGYLELSNGGKLQTSVNFPQNTDLTGGSTNGTDSNGLFAFYGGLSFNTGAGIVLHGEDRPVEPNVIKFVNGAFVERFRINENGTQKATFNDTLLKESTSYVHYDVNVATTDTQWTGVDYTKSAIFIDMDASGSGGNTADELRLYGIRTDIRSTHQTADLITGVYGYVESQHSTGTTSNLYGVYGYAVADDTGTGRTSNCVGVQGLSYGYGTGTGGVTTYYGGYFKTLLTSSADKNTTSAYGSRHEVEIDDPGQAQTLTNAYVVASEFDNDSASNVTITNSYLYYGNYAGTLPTNAYGLYILDGVQNYLAGSFSVGGTKNFRIKHPLPALAETHDLVHTVIESPSADNIYSGMINLVNGSATVNIDTIAGMTEGTFVALNRSVRRFVSNEEGFTAVKSSIAGNILTITAQDNTCTDEVFWMVIGQRQDAEIKATPGTDADGYLIVEPEHVEHVRPEKGEIYDERDIGPDTVEE